MRIPLVIGAALLAACGVTHVQAQAKSQDGCKSPQNTIEINDCAAQTLERKDKELNAAWQALMKSLSTTDKNDTTDYAGTRKKLTEAQRAWVQFRDADCEAKYTLNAGGTIRNMVALGCKIEHTEQRTKQLKAWNQG